MKTPGYGYDLEQFFLSLPDDLLESSEVCQLSSLVQTIHHQCEGGGESGEVEEEASK